MPSFNQETESILKIAQEAAKSRKNMCVGILHLLFGMVRIERGLAYGLLTGHGITAIKLGELIDVLEVSLSEKLPEELPRSKIVGEIVRIAPFEAEILGHNYVGAEHLLLAATNASAECWKEISHLLQIRFGLNTSQLRREVLDLLGHGKEKPFKETRQSLRFKKGNLCAWKTGNEVKPVLIEIDVPMFDNTALVSEGVRVNVDSLLFLCHVDDHSVKSPMHHILNLYQGTILLRLAGQLMSLINASKKTEAG
jgi:ATP-dependent Clp protease ATP-binding subunit ClpA